MTTAGEHLVAPLLRTFREAHCDLDITSHVGDRDDVFKRLLAREVDVAITGWLPDDGALHGRPFAPNEFVLIAAPGDPLAKGRSVAVQELGRPWLMREAGSGWRSNHAAPLRSSSSSGCSRRSALAAGYLNAPGTSCSAVGPVRDEVTRSWSSPSREPHSTRWRGRGR